MDRKRTTIEELSGFVYETRFEDLPSEVVTETKRLLLDSVGCALGGTTTDKGRWGLQFARKFFSGQPEATVFGFGAKLSPLGAAFANGELINALDYDAILPPGHVSPFVIPSLWAMAEVGNVSGKEVITACALAHEISHRIGKSLPNYRDIIEGKVVWPPVAGYSCSIFGGTAAVAKIERYSKETTAHALGIAGHIAPMQAHTAWKNHLPPSTTKYLLAGWISQAALTAASLAELGHRGDISAMDGEYGFWRYAGARKWDSSFCIDRLGKAWFFPPLTTFKPYPACRIMHGAFDCLSAIVERENLRPEEIESIRAYMESSVEEPLWQELKQVENHVDAQFNVAFTLSVVAHRLKPGPRWMDRDVLTDTKILRFMDRITYGVHPRYIKDLAEDPRSRTSKVELVARGKTFTHEKRYIKGSPSPDPATYMTDDELVAKFKDNAARMLPAAKIDDAIDCLVNLEYVKDMGGVSKLFSL